MSLRSGEGIIRSSEGTESAAIGIASGADYNFDVTDWTIATNYGKSFYNYVNDELRFTEPGVYCFEIYIESDRSGYAYFTKDPAATFPNIFSQPAWSYTVGGFAANLTACLSVESGDIWYLKYANELGAPCSLTDRTFRITKLV